MAVKRKSTKLRLEAKKGREIEGSKEKLYSVELKKGSSKIELGDFLARTEADAKKKARTLVRADIK